MVQPILHYYLALSIGHRARVGSLTQTFVTFSIPRRVGVNGPRGGGLIDDSRVVTFLLPPSRRRAFCSAPPEDTLLIVVALIYDATSSVLHPRSSLSQRARSQSLCKPATSRKYAVHAVHVLLLERVQKSGYRSAADHIPHTRRPHRPKRG